MNIKALLLIICITLLSDPYAFAKRTRSSGRSGSNRVWVKPHIRKNGSFVGGHWRTKRNSTKLDNWSYDGNTNPTTGEMGRKR